MYVLVHYVDVNAFVRPCRLQGLKNHAVTMFEVGKLTDESLDNFLVELGRVSMLLSICF